MTPTLALVIPLAALVAACASPATQAFDDGTRLYREGYVLSSRHAFDSAVHLDPRMPEAWNNRGVARVRLGDLDGAVLDYTHAIQLAPSDAELYFNRANAYAAAGNLVASVGDFTTATRLKPDYGQAYFNRGSVRAAAGDVKGALGDWQYAMEVESDPWTKAAMRRSSGTDYVYASPGARGGGVVAVMPPAPPSPEAITPQAIDVRSLVARAMSREVDGDRAGAVGDLRAAFAAETDPERRTRIEHLLRALEASR
jgi:tetratricopeptide (TPR) repeat protein